MSRSTRWLAVTLVIASIPAGVSAQDVEMLGRRYGTRPPEAYFREMRRNPGAFQFKRGRAAALRVGEALSGLGAGAGRVGGPALALGPRSDPVVGSVVLPVLLGLFDDSPTTPPFLRGQIQTAYFGAQAGTVSDYYAEISSDSISLEGDVFDWSRATLSESEVANGVSGLSGGRTAEFIRQLLQLQSGVDWGLYDNDGPDGVPNSGDDDGYVDALAVMHPSRGAECDGSTGRIWSHKWSLSEASGAAFTTGTVSRAGGFIQVDDYFIQGARACSGGELNPIGVFVHETGHAFGLPDLYDTRSGESHQGAGTWDLMAQGTWGCGGGTPFQPCHMGAWSKAQLGWVDVTTLAPDTDHGTLTLPPVETTGAVYRVDAADGSSEYFLIENRQRVPNGYDETLPAEGLLVWQIDAQAVASRWLSNTVNSDDHMGVWLRQADGLGELGQSGADRGDAGDPFPGLTANTEFHAASNPASVSFGGTATGLTMLGIQPVGDEVDFQLLTRFTQLTVESGGSASGVSGLFAVDGAPVPDPPANFVLSAPFQSRTVEAAAGAPLAEGERSPFLRWSDAPAEPRTRVVVTPIVDTDYVAEYAGAEYELQIALNGGINDVEPGTLVTTPEAPELWFEPGTDVVVTALPQTGFAFLGWTGPLAGQPNPVGVTMDAPVFAGADFELIYAAPDLQIAFPAAEPQSIQLTAQNGTSPVMWTLLGGSLPEGLTLSSAGRVSGSSLLLGAFPLTVEATDALGLTATAAVTLQVEVPPIPLSRLAATFLLTGADLTEPQEAFLDRQGNDDGVYDLGDFRAWVLANPSLPLSADLTPPGASASRTIVIPMRLRDPQEPR